MKKLLHRKSSTRVIKRRKKRPEDFYFLPGIRANVSTYVGVRVYTQEELLYVVNTAEVNNIPIKINVHIDAAYGEPEIWFSILPAKEPSSIKRFKKAVFLFQLCYEF